MRIDGRAFNEPRSCIIEPDFLHHALASVLVTTGRTRVLCAVSRDRTPSWLDTGGWVTAEYAMLPGSTSPRARRDPGGRGKEIQRLIGRSLRAAVDLRKLVGPDGPVALVCDCDVIDADGGTRTAAITGSWVALALATRRLVAQGVLAEDPIVRSIAAISVGIVEVGDAGPRAVVDLCYAEDHRAEVDLNIVSDPSGALIEVQGTAEGQPFTRAQLDEMLDVGQRGIAVWAEVQQRALERGPE